MEFELVSKYEPSGSQPGAINDITNNFLNGVKRQTLLGATGTGKTFTMCNIIKKLGKKTLILAHNKTLAGQLYNEIKSFFPNNHVCFFISYYDYYQPEAYVLATDTYIEKDSKINEEIDELRHFTTASLMDYDDVIVVASVSCIYGIGDPEEYKKSIMCISQNDKINKKDIIRRLVEMQYERNDIERKRATFRLSGDTLEIVLPFEHKEGIRIYFFDDEVEKIKKFDIVTGKSLDTVLFANIFAATHFMTSKEKLEESIRRIKEELFETKHKFLKEDKLLEAQRIEQRTNYDIEMLEQIGTCSGVENYSRHLSLRAEGETPYTLLDFFGDDFLLIIDESHVTLPQVHGMYNGDRARKLNLVNFGFRLPSALDNRPLKFDEFDSKLKQVLYVSATPGDFESKYEITEQIIRPTGLLDPIVTVKKTEGQIDDIYEQILKRKEKNERVLITTLTIKMSEDLTSYLKNLGLNVCYLHSEIKSLERLEILRDLRVGKYDCIVGINLLREGIDLPEVSLVCILDADKQGFLRSSRSLIQTIGRAARNASGEVIMYADSISEAMDIAIKETKRRRDIQIKYNQMHNITPQTINKAIPDSIHITVKEDQIDGRNKKVSKVNLEAQIKELEEKMNEYAKALDFENASIIRDELFKLKGLL